MTPESRFLHFLIGSWDLEGEMYLGPEAQKVGLKQRVDAYAVLGGRFI